MSSRLSTSSYRRFINFKEKKEENNDEGTIEEERKKDECVGKRFILNQTKQSGILVDGKENKFYFIVLDNTKEIVFKHKEELTIVNEAPPLQEVELALNLYKDMYTVATKKERKKADVHVIKKPKLMTPSEKSSKVSKGWKLCLNCETASK